MDWSKEAIMILAQIALLRNVCLTTFAYGRGRTAVVLLVFSLLLPGLAAAESGAQSAARRGKIFFSPRITIRPMMPLMRRFWQTPLMWT